MKVTVPVIRSFVHQGRAVSVGEGVTVTPVEASVLARQGYVSLLHGEYLRRDLDPDPVPAAESQPEPSPSAQPRRRRRRYRRRDLQAEP